MSYYFLIVMVDPSFYSDLTSKTVLIHNVRHTKKEWGQGGSRTEFWRCVQNTCRTTGHDVCRFISHGECAIAFNFLTDELNMHTLCTCNTYVHIEHYYVSWSPTLKFSFSLSTGEFQTSDGKWEHSQISGNGNLWKFPSSISTNFHRFP